MCIAGTTTEQSYSVPSHIAITSNGCCCLQYMDRIYVKHQNKVPVHQLGLDKWRDVVVRNKRVRERLLTTLLELVQKERTGEVIDRALMRSITMVSTAWCIVTFDSLCA